MITLESLSLGEILQKAGLNTLLGMGVVFTVLILISLLIYSMRFIPAMIDGLTGKKKEEPGQAADTAADTAGMPATQAAAPTPAVSAAGASPETDLALVAVITAAVAAAANVPADGIVIRSIRRSAKNNWKRA